jgi:hypothetical protein
MKKTETKKSRATVPLRESLIQIRADPNPTNLCLLLFMASKYDSHVHCEPVINKEMSIR